MRALLCLLLVATAAPAVAGASDAPYYGPLKRWHGIGFTFGYRDAVEKDGSWRVDATVRRGEAVDMAMYRAAELARERGHDFVQFLGGSASRSPGIASATVYVVPSDSAAPPAACRSKRRGTCYTADAAEVMRVLGGPGGTQPGVAIVDHIDRFGRQVYVSGFGIGKAVEGAPRVAVPAPPAPLPVAAERRAAPTAQQEANARFDRAMEAVQPVEGRDTAQGWTVSD